MRSLSGIVSGMSLFAPTVGIIFIMSSSYGVDAQTIPCPGMESFTINHVAGTVAPVTKSVTYGTVTNIPGETSKCWITHNLGADHQAASKDDATEASAGWYWQFNRKQGYKHDGTTRTPNTSWIDPINENLDWQLTNDPCALELGNEWRIPTYSEWFNVDATGSWTDWNGPWSSGLKLHAAGTLHSSNGSLSTRGIGGSYWSNIQYNLTDSQFLGFISSFSEVGNSDKAYGLSLRCISDASSFTTTPTITTTAVSDITQTTATSGGNVTSDGGATVTARGVCWSLTPSPTITNSFTTDGTGTGTFTSTISGLATSTTYYVRAYATNSVGTAYGDEITFMTLANGAPCPDVPTVLYEGKTYNTVQIGSQCWFKENLNIGTRINGNQNQTNNGTIEKYCYNDLETNCDIYGGMYQWNEMMQYTASSNANPSERKGICPNGWHLPSQNEWCSLFLQLDPGSNCNISGDPISSTAGGKMKEIGISHWNTPNTGATNEFGLTFLPSANRDDVGVFYGLLSFSHNWTTTESSSNQAVSTYLWFDRADVREASFAKTGGYAVRCIKDAGSSGTASVTTTAISNISQTTATGGGSVTSDGGASVTARGVCLSLSPSPTIADSHTTDGTGIGTFTSTISGLATSTTYYVRAYATNSVGTAYGNEVSFTTANSCPGIPSVTYGGQTYNTVQIGTQCWFKENLNIGTRINGSQNQINNGTVEKYCYNDLETNCDVYGGLYQWGEMVQYLNNASNSTSWNPIPIGDVIGICPEGWHIPSDEEWTTLTSSLGEQSIAGGKMKEAGTSHWELPNTGATNSSGFFGLPGGLGSPTPGAIFGFGYIGNTSYFGSSSEENPLLSFDRRLYHNSSEVGRGAREKYIGFSLRCLKDASSSTTTPTVTTTAVSDITQTTATSGGNVTSNGGASVTARGVCWSLTPSPTITDNLTTDGTGTGTFTSTISGLATSTTYYVRAYATNNVGTAYGNEVSFTTAWSCGTSITINHLAGTVAPVTKIVTYGTVTNIPGEPSKCWIISNLGADHQATAVNDASEASAGWYWQFNRKQGYKHDGSNRTPNTTWNYIDENSDWISANDPCAIEFGSGWRIPTSTEWSNFAALNGPWYSDLKLHAAGTLNTSGGSLFQRGSYGWYWSSTQAGSNGSFHLSFTNGGGSVSNSGKSFGNPLRCLKATTPSTTPDVTTASVSNIYTQPSANCGGNVLNDGGDNVTERGVCWNTASNPTTTNSRTSDGFGTGVFTSTLSGLVINTTYYVRAYATNSAGTGYGNEVSFTTSEPPYSCGLLTVNHLTGILAPVTKTITYGTVTNIPGETTKCWITSNLGADYQATSVGDGTEASAGWYWQFNRKQGYKHDGTARTPNTNWDIGINELYNWENANDPCALELGSGWRIPTQTEWENVDAIGSWTNWNGPWNSGLKLHAAGYLSAWGGSLDSRGSSGKYWSSSQSDAPNGRVLNFNSGQSNMDNNMKSEGHTLRCIREDAPATPTVSTATVSNITQNTAASGGNITSDGGASVTARGVCWSTSQNPTVSDSHTTDGSGAGTYTSTITGITANTTYYVKAYATNSVGTAYGNQIAFTTFSDGLPCPGIPTFTDPRDGRVYNTVQIGTQCWMKDNLNIGTRINGSQEQTNNNIIEKYCYGDGESTCNVYGGLYLWNEIMQYVTTEGTQGICPAGWHIPTDAEFTTLTSFLGGISVAGGKMKETGTTHWTSPNTGATNISGFTALAGGDRDHNGTFYTFGDFGIYWSSTEISSSNAWDRHLYYFTDFLDRFNSLKSMGYSVRCLWDAGSSTSTPTVTTSAVTNITHTTATSGGNVTSDGGTTVTARGICWSLTPNPTITDSHTTDGTGTGNFTSAITGLIANTTYYVRAFATNSIGTGYGNELNFKTPLISCPGTTTVSYGGITYNTVQLGSQCWLKENLNIGTRINGSQNQTNNGFLEKYCYDDIETNCDVFGGLYQWNEMMQYVTTEGTQGICPTGWHLPSDGEWTTLTSFLGGNPGQDGGKMKETGYTHWYSPNTGATNASYFTALGGGYCLTVAFVNQYSNAEFWSSSEYSSSNAWYRYLHYNSDGMMRDNSYSKTGGFSVRCLKDLSSGTASVTTTVISDITQTTATSGGNVTSDGGASVTARGVCWSASPNPTTSDFKTTDGTGTGTFTSIITGLTGGTLYFVRAYATNSVGTSFGNELTFTTLNPCPGIPTITVSHIAGTVAPVDKTVTYGTVTGIPGEPSKCWITSNLGADHQATSIDDNTEASAGWYWQFNRKQGYKHDGSNRTPNTAWINLINENLDWQATNDPCTIELGSGWRVPTLSEWTNVDVTGNWTNSPDPWNSGLKLHSAGFLNYSNGTLTDRGYYGYYWSNTQSAEYNNYGLGLTFRIGDCGMTNMVKAFGSSVRCLKDTGGSTATPTVSTTSVSNIGQNTANSGGNVTSDGGASVTARGVCWSTSQNPTITDVHTTDGTGTGTFTSTISGLASNSLYYVRAYATNSVGTGYGNELNFTSLCASYAPVSVVISPSANPVCSGTTVTFTATPTNGGPLPAYQWKVNGVNVNGATNATYAYIPVNNHAVTCVLTSNEVCTTGSPATSNVVTMTVNPLPAAAGAVSGPATVCQGQTAVTYAVPTIANATAYSWTLPTGASIVGTSSGTITVNFSSSAVSGYMSVQGSNSCGYGTISGSYTITVNPLPAAAGPITGLANVCQGQNGVTYSVAAITYATSYIWTYSGTGATISNGTTNNISISFATTATSGNLAVQGTNSCGNGSTSASYPITVNPLPGAAGAIIGLANVCQGQNGVTYSVPAIANATGYSWTYSGTGATISNGATNNITISFASNATSGTLTVQGINSCGNGIPSANYPITVNPLPGPAGTIIGTLAVCQEQNAVAYSVPTIANATGYNWTIPTGASIISGANINIIVVNFSASAISGDIVVQGTNTCGAGMGSSAFSITVGVPPAAHAGPDAAICQGSDYTVTGASASNFSSLSWTTAGTGSFINESTLNPTYIPSAADVNMGLVTLTLTTTGITPCTGTASDEMVLTISPLPAASGVITGPTSVCQGQAGVSYAVAAISNATSYIWAYSGTGATITHGATNNISISFSTEATSGNLTVMGSNSCGNGTISASYPITVNPIPAAAGTITGLAAVCQGQTGEAYSVPTIAEATGYTWTLPTGATIVSGNNTNSITVDFSATSISGNITVTGTNDCGSGTISANYTITVNPLPAAAGVITGATAVCLGQSGVIYSVSLIANATGYNWTIPTGATITSGANTNLIAVTFSASAMDGNITVQGTNGCGTSMISPSFTVTVTPPPMAHAGADAQICEGSVYTISGAMASNFSSFLWTTSGTGAFINVNTFTPTYVPSAADVAAGSALLTLSAFGITPCTGASTDEMLLTINPLPSAAGTIIGLPSVCQGQTGVSYSIPLISHATSYEWTYSGTGATITNGSTNNIILSFASNATSGNLSVMGVNSCGNGAVSSPSPVNVNLHPMANFSFSNNPILGEPVQFTDLSQTNGGGALTSWLWNFGEPASGVNNTSTIQNPLHTFITLSVHPVTLVVQNTSGCPDTLEQPVVVSLPHNAAPFTYAGSLGAGSGYPVLVPITVTGFDSIAAISLRVDYNPNVMTYDSSANMNEWFSDIMVNDLHVSDTLHKVMISWAYIRPVSLPDDSKLVDLAFTFISGMTTVAFNNESNGGLDCDYTDANGNPMIDIPSAIYYNNGAVHEGLDLTGAFSYNNAANTALDSLWVILKENGVKVDSARANIIGRYDFFNIPSNTYTLWAHSAKPWGGVNSTDALKIQLHFSGLELLTVPVRLLAADVNNSDNINLADAIKVQRRFIGLDTAFARGDWTFAKPTGGDTVIVAGDNVVQDLQGLCVGDVDGSHIPLPGHKSMEGVSLLAESMIEVRQGQEFELPVKIAMDGQIGAISLVLAYPVEELELINITISRGNVMYTARNGQIRMAWSQIEPMNLIYGDVLLTLKFKLSEAAPLGVPLILDIGQESELADGWGERIAHSIISIPSVVPVKSTGLGEKSDLITRIMLYPNPTTGKAWLAFELLMDASVVVEGYNMVGELVTTLRFDGLSMGKHKKELDVSELATGVYTLKTTVRGRSTSTVYHKLVVTK